ncbi:hypothetical protein GCM10027563_35970 [Parasphingorhabdus pacifica]
MKAPIVGMTVIPTTGAIRPRINSVAMDAMIAKPMMLSMFGLLRVSFGESRLARTGRDVSPGCTAICETLNRAWSGSQVFVHWIANGHIGPAKFVPRTVLTS